MISWVKSIKNVQGFELLWSFSCLSISGFLLNSAVASLVGAPLGIAIYATELNICAINSGI